MVAKSFVPSAVLERRLHLAFIHPFRTKDAQCCIGDRDGLQDMGDDSGNCAWAPTVLHDRLFAPREPVESRSNLADPHPAQAPLSIWRAFAVYLAHG